MIHGQFPMSYAMNNDFKYQASDRQQAANSISSGGYLDRKDLGHGSLNSSMSIGASNSGMDYTVNQMQHDVPLVPLSFPSLSPPLLPGLASIHVLLVMVRPAQCKMLALRVGHCNTLFMQKIVA